MNEKENDGARSAGTSPEVPSVQEVQRLRQIENDYRALAMCIGADPDWPADRVFDVALELWREMKARSERK